MNVAMAMDDFDQRLKRLEKRKMPIEMANTIADCMVQLADVKLRLQAFETALHKAADEALYILYTAELERLRNSQAHITNAASLSELRKRLLQNQ